MKGVNPRIKNGKNSRERGDIEHTEKLEKQALEIENGTALKEASRKIEEWCPKEQKEKDSSMMKEYERELISYTDY